MNLPQALTIAVIQGATELFPVSSLGHAVILPQLLHWNIDQKAPDFLPFLVVLHLGTAAALLLYFWRDWAGFIAAISGQGDQALVKGERKVFGYLITATIPAALFGFALEHLLQSFFGSPTLASIFLIINGFVLFLGEKLRRLKQPKIQVKTPLAQIGWQKSLLIGSCQALALIPGISRSGSTMVAGLIAGLSHEDAARFSFLLATPVILGAGVLEIPKLMHMGGGGLSPTVIIAGVVSGVTAFLSTTLLMRYFKQHELDAALYPFAVYCWLAGICALAWLTLA